MEITADHDVIDHVDAEERPLSAASPGTHPLAGQDAGARPLVRWPPRGRSAVRRGARHGVHQGPGLLRAQPPVPVVGRVVHHHRGSREGPTQRVRATLILGASALIASTVLGVGLGALFACATTPGSTTGGAS